MNEPRRVVVQYQPRADRADENQRLVEAVYAALDRDRPDGFQYATYRLEDDSFVHVASIDAGVTNPLEGLAEFTAFSGGVADRCDNPPVAATATLVGSYRADDRAPAAQ
jgi:hypothetical protein